MAGAAERGGLSLAAGAPAAVWPGTRAARSLWWRPPRLAVVLTAVALIVHLAVCGPSAPLGRSVWSGLAIETLGLGWLLWAASRFRAAGTPIWPTERPQRFVDDGPFRFGRNPMYLGMTVSMLGLALKLGAPTLVVAAAAFAVIVQRVYIPHEETRRRAAFGGWYSDYAASVRRWLCGPCRVCC